MVYDFFIAVTYYIVISLVLLSSKSTKYEYEGITYHFCDTECEVEFKSRTEKCTQKEIIESSIVSENGQITIPKEIREELETITN